VSVRVDSAVVTTLLLTRSGDGTEVAAGGAFEVLFSHPLSLTRTHTLSPF